MFNKYLKKKKESWNEWAVVGREKKKAHFECGPLVELRGNDARERSGNGKEKHRNTDNTVARVA